jgi:hypothetical protein
MAKFKMVTKPYRVICFRNRRADSFDYFKDHAEAREQARLASFHCDMARVEVWTGEQWVTGVSPPSS